MADTIGIADPRDTDHRYQNFMRRHCLLPLQLLVLIFMLGIGASAYAAVPGAPTIVSATAGNAQATIAFTLGSGGISYTATCGTFIGTGTASPITVTGLSNGTSYPCSVTATNLEGTSLPSASITMTPAATVPGAPTSVSAKLAPATHRTMVSFTAPDSDGGSAITGYTATCDTNPGLTFVEGTASPITITHPTISTASQCFVTATNAVGYASSSAVSVTLATVPSAPTIVSATPGDAQVTVTFTATTPTLNGGSAITAYTATCDTVIGTGTASPITVTGLSNGTTYQCSVTATNDVGTSLASIAAPNPVVMLTPQTITFGTQTGKVFGVVPFALNPLATASSSLAVTYTSTTTSVCTISGSTITIVSAGICTTAANQAGNASYAAAPQVTQNIVISKGTQTITFGAQTSKVFGVAAFALSPLATATSKLAVTYTSTTPTVCTISGSTVTLVSAGTCTIVAEQAGDANYNAATQVPQNIVISKGTQTITFGTQTAKTFSTTPFQLSPLATASSSLAVAYTSTTPLVCTISGSTVTIVAAGTCTIAANQAGDANYSAATQVTQNITISKGTQTITFGTQSGQIIGVAPFALSPLASASSGLEVSYSSTTAKVCTISGTNVTALTTGTCTISASQAGNGNYSAATAVTQNITIGNSAAPGAPTLTGITAGYGSATLSFSAPASNGGSTITAYTATCTATGETTLTGTGSSTTSTIIVQGLTLNVTYSCSVAASNSVGIGAASTALPVTSVAFYIIPTASSPLTGLWWNEQEPGWGMSVTQHGAMIFMGWYAYDASGASTWYVMPSCPILGNACTGEIYSVSGGSSFVTPWDGSAKVVTPVGTGILTFNNANAGTFNYSMNGTSGLISIARQVFATGLTAPVPDFSDLWWNPGESGWGVSLTQQYGVIFAVVYGYDANGKPIWYVASDCRVDGNYCSGSLYQVKGGTVPTTTWDGANLVVTTVGFIEFVFGDASNGIMNYFINGVAGTKVITRQLF